MAATTARGTALLRLDSPIDLGLTVSSHGWAQLAPFRWAEGTLARRERVEGGLGTIAIRQRGLCGIAVRWAGFAAPDSGEILRRVGRWLSADWPPAAAIAALPQARGLIERGGGRLLRGSFFYEDFVKTVLTINTNWSATCRMASALVAEPGGGAFPGPQDLLDYGEERLRARARLGFRAPTLLAATSRMLADGAIDRDGSAAAEDGLSYEYLIALKGIGPYAAAHCRLLLHDFARIPVDSAVVRHLRERYGASPGEFAERHAGWGAYLALGYRLARLAEKLQPAAAASPATEEVA